MNEVAMLLTILGAVLVPVLLIGVVMYVITSLAYKKVFDMYEYQNWVFAWIPFLRTYALADVCVKDEPEVVLLGMHINSQLFKFWWVIQLVVAFIPYIGGIASFVLQIICLGHCYTTVYADMDDKTYSESQGLGYLSSVISLIFIIKALFHR